MRKAIELTDCCNIIICAWCMQGFEGSLFHYSIIFVTGITLAVVCIRTCNSLMSYTVEVLNAVKHSAAMAELLLMTHITYVFEHRRYGFILIKARNLGPLGSGTFNPIE